ncbi:DUF5324 family protein [Streptomyces sp. WMMC500]|uniref:DUF5324 family protein n=1 Tax=Streptomyces sp. WMMC500 TaxID=3015154 RepID=UPI00248B6D2B|nr:DUF5324 family protein [Streptomyces sp. WMMC500]WBB57881.1 DUF5324 family protein [Streptomyces sp. WMMC500]
MTRKNGARTATDTAKHSVQQAAEAMAPYAASARNQCAHMAHEARERFGPKVSDLATSAQVAYCAHLEPRVRKVRRAVPGELDRTAADAARRARDAAAYAAPRIVGAAAATKAAAVATKAAAGPATRQAAARGTAALSALKGEVSPAEIDELARKRHRREVVGRTAKGTVVAGALGAGALVAWRWWDRQVNPDWMVEPTDATEPGTDASTTRIVDDTEYMDRETRIDRADAGQDPDAQARQAASDMDAEGGGTARSEAGEATDTGRAYDERENDR